MLQPVNSPNGTRDQNAEASMVSTPQTVLMTMIGEFDISSRMRLGGALNRLRDATNVILDLTEVRYLDSTAIGEFIRLHKVRKAKGFPREIVVLPNEKLRRIFDILNLAEVFTIAGSLEQAVSPGDDVVALDFIAEVPALDGYHLEA